MKKYFVWLAAALLAAACTKDGDTIYLPDPNEEPASSGPMRGPRQTISLRSWKARMWKSGVTSIQSFGGNAELDKNAMKKATDMTKLFGW